MTSRTSVLRVTTPLNCSASQTKTARTSGLASRRPASCAVASAGSEAGSGTIASRTRLIGSRVDSARLERSRHLADPCDERRVPQRQALLRREIPDPVERVRHLLPESDARLVAAPEQAPEILDPLEVGDGHAAGVREDDGEDRDAPLREDGVRLE